MLVGGGGARNPTLLTNLRRELSPTPVVPLDQIGVDPDAKEAMAFALLAHDALLGLPTNAPAATGARRPVPIGQLTLATRQKMKGQRAKG